MRAPLLSSLVLAFSVAAQIPDPAPAPAFEMAPGVVYDAAIPTLDQVTGHAWGTEISAHRDVEAYIRALEAAAPDRVRVLRYGETWQGRGLYYVAVSKPEHVSRLPAIQAAMQRLADPRGLDDRAADALIDELPAVGWLANCVHGDEPSGTDAALYVLYHLVAAKGDPLVQQILEETVVLIDPLQNPDGRDRFVFYTRGARGRWPDPTPTAAEHSQPWPSGRTNHAMFDMNRDWFALSQPETEGRVRTFLEWWPLVYVDLHEMGGNSSYYFPPPAEPVNETVTAAQRAWLRRMYAMRAMRANKHTEARALLTEALNEASSLRGNAAHMLQALLELRADVHDALGDAPKAVSDRERAASMRAMLPEGSKEPAGVAA